ncbi:MAG: 50S ribosomal protein L7/L12 [Candidatus Amesbacteria bacterium GW2011_GWB1_47_26]|uniref:Large ribosomal subunit protein bL12 n=1 Tax=Candidatus Amesbacteria bacterium GW2011_GWC2_45_19 TaxID=1618366 RepID=A0A0G1M3T3_9BACT|nr:MAG: 50S ribosomal protein L7/L12 [Candidatus Amesbacteria bacterium GW2011_GWC2_45_19]KKU37683.1 MAG: 50S ribosomal protein L7/L12 [Candidatus Amesbacteria bacterium GW2011_GWA1_46_35]KKU68463.1 MAG: LSU ribosomal protein L12P [Microgenomates group bacterium GW2011_GWC1_47_20]KKU74189.1 MAG: 50S ribosomal protein L7/L12 [Candidatus Amesbacteria bacterium GW2011_GWB1_47_26]KKU78516.1 MAG: 50S ribosomal protein L7/L12 [Candidatus Amesbacteria bacterium GW2011_GWA2_47_70]
MSDNISSIKLQKIIDAVSELTVVELADLVKSLEEKFGVSASVAAAPAAASAPSGDSGEPQQDAFDVILTSTGANKIGVIKALREINPQLGLKEAKDLSEKPGAEILNGANKTAAEEAKAKLVAAGATVELK